MSSEAENGDKTAVSERTQMDTNISSKAKPISKASENMVMQSIHLAKTMVESTTSSLERRACRICQSETGAMVRPCGCSGTMGDIHENCLSTWVAMSKKEKCEICKEEYAKSGWCMKEFKEWTKPKLGSEDIVSGFVVIGLVYSIYYLCSLFNERLFLARISNGLSIRSDDYGRLVIFIIMVTTFLAFLLGIFRQIRGYFAGQREIRFVNKNKSGSI